MMYQKYTDIDFGFQDKKNYLITPIDVEKLVGVIFIPKNGKRSESYAEDWTTHIGG